MTDLSILDLSLAKLQASTIDPEDVPALIKAEEAGKTRKGVIAYLNSLIAPSEPENPPAEDFCEVENIVPGSDLTLEGGEHILFGETATVRAGFADFLRERGQVR